MSQKEKCCEKCSCPGEGFTYPSGVVHMLCSGDFCHVSNCYCHSQKESEWGKQDTRTHLENSLVDVAVAGEKGFSDNLKKAMENHLDRCMEEISLAVSNREKEIAEEVARMFVRVIGKQEYVNVRTVISIIKH